MTAITTVTNSCIKVSNSSINCILYTSKFEAAGLKITKIEGEAKEAFIKKASAMYADPALGFPQGLFEKIQEIIK